MINSGSRGVASAILARIAASSFLPVRLQQPENLPRLQPQKLSGAVSLQPPQVQIADDLQPCQLAFAHYPHRHRHLPPTLGLVSFQSGRALSFSCGRYTRASNKPD